MWCEMFSFLHADNYSIVPLKGINNLFKGSVEFRIVAPWGHVQTMQFFGQYLGLMLPV